MKTPRIKIDHDRREIFVYGVERYFPPSEYGIIKALRDSNKAMSRESLAEALGRSKSEAELYAAGRVIDQHVARARRKLGPGVILTVSHVGYKIAAGCAA